MGRITDAQVKELRRQLQGGSSLKKSALKAGMDRKSARKYREGKMPRERRAARSWRTRSDPLARVWPELAAELERAPGLQANTLLAVLQERHPGEYGNEVLRTLQRRVRQWRALSGPAKEVFFAQVHEPGRLGSSDFTHMNELGVTIQGQRFDHLVHHFVLTYSNWEHVSVCFSESFASLSEGLQNALWALGGVPQRHRTDRMTLAVHPDGNPEVFTQNYRALMGHYGVKAEATNPYSGHENGDCEQGHRRFKEAVGQALLLRGSRDFASRSDYERFLHTVQEQRNAGRRQRLAEELPQLAALPARRLESLVRLSVKVSQGSTIRVQHNIYSVPSRLKGEWLEARVGAETIEVWYAEQLQVTLPRLRGQDKHRIDYRHVIDWLVRKPGAFARYCYQADLFPTSRFRQAYDELLRTLSERPASRAYLEILQLAAQGSESAVDGALAKLLAEGRPLSRAAVEALVQSDANLSVTTLVQVAAVDLHSYDGLLPTLFGETVSCGGLLSQEHKEAKDGSGTEGVAGGMFAGVAPAGDAAGVRSGGATSAAGVVELPGFSGGIGGAGGAAAASEPHRPAVEGVAAAVGEKLAEPGPEALAGEGDPAVAQLVIGGFSGPARECVGVRQCGLGKNAQPLRRGSGVGSAGTANPVHDDEPAGAGVAQSQTRPGPEVPAQATEPLGRLADRRPGLCATEPGGNGGVVHALGGTVRAWQRVGDEQPGVLAVGADLQGPDDNGGSHRPAGAPLRDPGTECAQLSSGGGQESTAGSELNKPVDTCRRQCVGPPWGSGEAPLASAPVVVAARPLPPLRLAPLPRTPKAEGFETMPVGILNCR